MAKEIELKEPLGKHGGPDGKGSREQDLRRGRRRHYDRHHPRPGDLPRGQARTSPPAPTPWELKRGIEKAVAGCHRRAEEAQQAGQGQDDRPGRHHLGQQRRDDREPSSPRRWKKWARTASSPWKKAKSMETVARGRGGDAVRPRLPLPLLRDRPRAHGVRCSRTPIVLIHEKKISNMKDLLPVLEQVAKLGQPLLDRGRGLGRRGAGHAGREQAPAAHCT